MKKVLILCCMICLVISCSDDDQALKSENHEIDLFLRSKAFLDLQIKEISTLDLAKASSSNVDQFVYVMIPIKGSDGSSLVLGKAKNEDFRIASILTYNGSQKNEEINRSIESGRFTGNITMKYNLGIELSLEFKNGDLSSKKIKSRDQERIQGCGRVGSDLWVERVGDCVGRSIEDMGTAGKVACFWGIIACVGIEALDCIEAGCPV